MKIVIYGNPIPKNRIRCRCLHGHGQAYDSQAKEMKQVREAILLAWNELFSDPESPIAQEALEIASSKRLSVKLSFYLPINKSDPASLKNAKLWGLSPCTEKPDIDNLAKLYLDCSNEILWTDDKIITHAEIDKVKYSLIPRTEIEVMNVPEMNLTEKTVKVLHSISPDELSDMLASCANLTQFQKPVDEFANENETIDEALFYSLALYVKMFCDKYSPLISKIAKIKE